MKLSVVDTSWFYTTAFHWMNRRGNFIGVLRLQWITFFFVVNLRYRVFRGFLYFWFLSFSSLLCHEHRFLGILWFWFLNKKSFTYYEEDENRSYYFGNSMPKRMSFFFLNTAFSTFTICSNLIGGFYIFFCLR